MKFHSSKSERAFTLIEVMVLSAVAVGALFLMVVLKQAARPKGGGMRIKCVSNLKQIGLAYKVFAGDNDDRYPYSTTNGLAYLDQTRAWLHFQAMSNELSTAKVLTCPADRIRAMQRAENFNWGTNASTNSLVTAGNAGVSYFINLHTDETRPLAILAGDCHVAPNANTAPYSSKSGGAANIKVGAEWSAVPQSSLHGGNGNILLGDGSVSQANNSILKSVMQLSVDSYGTNANRFLFPQ